MARRLVASRIGAIEETKETESTAMTETIEAEEITVMTGDTAAAKTVLETGVTPSPQAAAATAAAAAVVVVVVVVAAEAAPPCSQWSCLLFQTRGGRYPLCSCARPGSTTNRHH